MKQAASPQQIFDQMRALLESLESMDNLEYQNNKFRVDRRILIRALKNFLKFF